MPQSTGRLIRACLLTATLTFVPAVLAGIVEPTPFVLPADSAYSVPDTCISVVCLENIALGSFDITSNMILAGNQVVMANVTLTANLFQNVLGSPGPFITAIQLNGQADITYSNKTTFSEFGTFDSQITLLNLAGSFNGLTGPHTLVAMLNPLDPTTGQTTVEPLGTTPQTFEITSFFDVFTELSVDSGPFVPGPERTADLTATPEPSFYGALGLVLAGLAVWRFAGARRRTTHSAAVTAS